MRFWAGIVALGATLGAARASTTVKGEVWAYPRYEGHSPGTYNDRGDGYNSVVVRVKHWSVSTVNGCDVCSYTWDTYYRTPGSDGVYDVTVSDSTGYCYASNEGNTSGQICEYFEEDHHW